ncbi:photosynthetic complex putative assembly protein PuhB [Sphingomonas spermidinifaciens]|nr:photosynthetic complex putative assembly protein PuhB [Sphingomonas spermidinifaciens]
MEHEVEPVPGLPGHLPPGETMLWQGRPDRASLARHAFHTRGVAIYFALLTALALASGGPTAATITAGLGVAAVGLLHLFAWGAAKTTIYTLTDRRVVLRIGTAVPKCVNLPLSQIGAVDMAVRRDGTGDLPLTLASGAGLGYLALWPHARPFRLGRPQPMLRSLQDPQAVAALLARACLAAGAARAEVRPVAVPLFEGAQAA